MSQDRAFPNEFPPYNVEISKQFFKTEHPPIQLNNEFRIKYMHAMTEIFTTWDSKISRKSTNDSSIYTGTCGHAFLYTFVSDRLNGPEYLEKAIRIVDQIFTHQGKHKDRVYTFICGDGGPLALKAVICQRTSDLAGRDDAIKQYAKNELYLFDRLLDCKDSVLYSTQIPDEILYGRAGYLYCLLYIHRHCGPNTFVDETIDQIKDKILESGINAKGRFALNYSWHGSEYLGAAHGFAGILFLLMRTPEFNRDNRAKQLVKTTLDQMLQLRYSSGNFPSSIGSNTDKLVHWCHGAPGWIHTLAEAYRVYSDETYLAAARKCAEVIWNRGLLKKGHGLCHGVAGNAYGLLILWKITKDPVYLYQTYQFARWTLDYAKHECPTPDRPYSLFEGLAGTLYFLIDILEPESAEFPCFY